MTISKKLVNRNNLKTKKISQKGGVNLDDILKSTKTKQGRIALLQSVASIFKIEKKGNKHKFTINDQYCNYMYIINNENKLKKIMLKHSDKNKSICELLFINSIKYFEQVNKMKNLNLETKLMSYYSILKDIKTGNKKFNYKTILKLSIKLIKLAASKDIDYDFYNKFIKTLYLLIIEIIKQKRNISISKLKQNKSKTSKATKSQKAGAITGFSLRNFKDPENNNSSFVFGGFQKAVRLSSIILGVLFNIVVNTLDNSNFSSKKIEIGKLFDFIFDKFIDPETLNINTTDMFSIIYTKSDAPNLNNYAILPDRIKYSLQLQEIFQFIIRSLVYNYKKRGFNLTNININFSATKAQFSYIKIDGGRKKLILKIFSTESNIIEYNYEREGNTITESINGFQFDYLLMYLFIKNNLISDDVSLYPLFERGNYKYFHEDKAIGHLVINIITFLNPDNRKNILVNYNIFDNNYDNEFNINYNNNTWVHVNTNNLPQYENQVLSIEYIGGYEDVTADLEAALRDSSNENASNGTHNENNGGNGTNSENNGGNATNGTHNENNGGNGTNSENNGGNGTNSENNGGNGTNSENNNANNFDNKNYKLINTLEELKSASSELESKLTTIEQWYIKNLNILDDNNLYQLNITYYKQKGLARGVREGISQINREIRSGPNRKATQFREPTNEALPSTATQLALEN